MFLISSDPFLQLMIWVAEIPWQTPALEQYLPKLQSSLVTHWPSPREFSLSLQIFDWWSVQEGNVALQIFTISSDPVWQSMNLNPWRPSHRPKELQYLPITQSLFCLHSLVPKILIFSSQMTERWSVHAGKLVLQIEVKLDDSDEQS